MLQDTFGLMLLFNTQTLIITSGFLLLATLYSLIIHRISVRAADAGSIWLESFVRSIHMPFYVLLLSIWFYQMILQLPKSTRDMFSGFTHNAETMISFVVALIILITFNRFLSNVQDKIINIERNQAFPNSPAWVTACKLGRMLSGIVFVMVVLNMFDVPIGQLLAPTAVGALALSFASKDVLSNVFGGLMVMCDRPFVVGDYVSIRSGEEGTVRYIGWRMTEIQLQNGRILHVPNGLLTTTMVTNYSEKSYWFVQKEFGLRYSDIEIAKEIAQTLEEWLTSHPLANKRRVHFAKVFNLSDSAVVIRSRVYLKNTITTKDWYKFNEDLIYHMNDLVKSKKADFAFPTRTVYMEKED